MLKNIKYNEMSGKDVLKVHFKQIRPLYILVAPIILYTPVL